MSDGDEGHDRLALTAKIVSAYLRHNHVPASQLPSLIASVSTALHGLGGRTGAPVARDQPQASAAEIRRSITPEALISFEDGKPYKALRRHLTGRGLTPEAYRAKWGLPADYPMTASAYSAARSQLALDLGLGRKRTSGKVGSPVPAAGEGPLTDSIAKPTVADRQLAAATSPSSDAASEPAYEDTIVREPFEDDGEAL